MGAEFLSRLDAYLQSLPWQAIGDFLVKNEVNAAWCAATLLYFLICLGRLLWRVLPIRRALRRVAAPLAGVEKTGFASRFEEYDKTVLAQRSLEHAWREFDGSLVKPTEGEAQVIRNTHDPALYFNDATIVQPAVHTRFFDTVPSQLVGLGILGTFVGLAA